MAAIKGPQQGRVTTFTVFGRLPQIGLGPSLQQRLHMRQLPPVGGQHQHGGAGVRQQVGVGAVAQGLSQCAGIARILGVHQTGICRRPNAR